MNGVEILATEEVVAAYAFNWVGFFVTWCAVIAIFLVAGLIVSLKYGDLTLFLAFVVVGVVMGIIFGIFLGSGCRVPIAYENQYKVTISDEVQMNEFFEKYKIVDQEGKIYTVRENAQ
jgi:hypothetical protein